MLVPKDNMSKGLPGSARVRVSVLSALIIKGRSRNNTVPIVRRLIGS